jgi:hypothetical protein
MRSISQEIFMLTNLFLKFTIVAIFCAATSFLATHRTGPAVLRSAVTPQVTIAALLADKDRFSNSAVRVSGTIASHGRFAILGYGGFRLRDQTGAAITVLSHGAGVPPVGTALTVMGIYKNAFQVGSFDVPVIVQD